MDDGRQEDEDPCPECGGPVVRWPYRAAPWSTYIECLDRECGWSW